MNLWARDDEGGYDNCGTAVFYISELAECKEMEEIYYDKLNETMVKYKSRSF